MSDLNLDFLIENFSDKKINFSIALTMTEYSKRISKFTTAIFQANIIKNTLPEMLSLH
jgi:hypothetical protein